LACVARHAGAPAGPRPHLRRDWPHIGPQCSRMLRALQRSHVPQARPRPHAACARMHMPAYPHMRTDDASWLASTRAHVMHALVQIGLDEMSLARAMGLSRPVDMRSPSADVRALCNGEPGAGPAPPDSSKPQARPDVLLADETPSRRSLPHFRNAVRRDVGHAAHHAAQ
jgi:hypothetical protein